MFPFTAVGLRAILSNFSGSHKAETAVLTLYLAVVKATKSSACITSLASKGRICSTNSEESFASSSWSNTYNSSSQIQLQTLF